VGLYVSPIDFHTTVIIMNFIMKIMIHAAHFVVFVAVIYQSNITQKRKDNNYVRSKQNQIHNN